VEVVKHVIGSLALFGLILSACGGGTAATVDGANISVSDVGSLRIMAAPTEADFATDLSNLIINQVITATAREQFGVKLTDGDRQAQIDLVTAQIEAGGSTLDATLEGIGFTMVFLEVFANREALTSKVSEELTSEIALPTDEEVQETYDTEVATYENQVVAQEEAYELQLKFLGMEACTSHILLAAEADANVALERLEDGEAFADLAVELSTGPSGPTGGDLGCSSPAGFVPEFAEAVSDGEIGVPLGPVETEFGFHVILIASREVDETVEPPVAPDIPRFPPFEEAQPQILANLTQNAYADAFQSWFTAAVRGAEVTVSEQFGTWTVPDDAASLPFVTPPPATEPAP
jgi:peptidyl-prolyl cis-trans isomerase C